MINHCLTEILFNCKTFNWTWSIWNFSGPGEPQSQLPGSPRVWYLQDIYLNTLSTQTPRATNCLDKSKWLLCFLSPTATVMFTVGILQQATFKPANIIAYENSFKFTRRWSMIYLLCSVFWVFFEGNQNWFYLLLAPLQVGGLMQAWYVDDSAANVFRMIDPLTRAHRSRSVCKTSIR